MRLESGYEGPKFQAVMAKVLDGEQTVRVEGLRLPSPLSTVNMWFSKPEGRMISSVRYRVPSGQGRRLIHSVYAQDCRR